MPLYQNLETLKKARQKYSGNQCGLVPTMGALHHGHLELIKQAQQQNQSVWVTIFLNPTQFNNPKDLDKYPVSLAEDVKAIYSIDPNINVFAPNVEDMYPEQIAAKEYTFNGLDAVMEGADRPGHFEGVITIVSKLFELIKPHNAYFGEKDFQQVQIIKNWRENNAIPVEIIGCPIVRESNGLAMSSRNELLSKAVRDEAGFIYTTLKNANKSTTISELYSNIKADFSAHPLFKLQYVLCVDEKTLQEVNEIDRFQNQRIFIATSVEGVRLIDNIALK